MHVAIPSKGRAVKIKSHRVIPSAFVYVPEYEAEAYNKMRVQNVVPVPASIKGITQTRNWILDNVSDPHVVFIDDDVIKAGYHKMMQYNAKWTELGEAAILREWVKLFNVMEDLKYRIWGISTDGAPRSVYPYKPFLFHTYVTASCMGVLNDGRTKFDESFPVKEDYELCLRCIKEDGGILGARYMVWQNSHWKDEGGCKDYRTQQMEETAIKRLMKMYPGFIRRVKRGGAEYSIDLSF